MVTTGRPLVSARVLADLHAFLSERGLADTDVTRDFGFDVAQTVARDGYFDLGEVMQLFEIMAMRTDDDAFGLHYGEACALGSVGVVYYTAANAPTLRTALQIRARRSDIMVNADALSFTEEGGIGRFRWKSGAVGGPRRQFIDYVAALFVTQIRTMLCDRSWSPLKTELSHSPPRPGCMAEFERVFGTKIAFGNSHSALHIDAQSLARPLPNADPALHRALMSSFDKLATDTAATVSIVEKARLHMIRGGSFVAESEEDVARALNISVRTLQREFARSGTSFRAMADCARKQAALQLLHDTNLPLTEVAFRLGFSELSAFSRAAKKWFGRTAGEVRSAQHDGRKAPGSGRKPTGRHDTD